ncbi:MAG TPA: hypothetical protein VF892_03400 [Pseudonocardiaceae bacterium]
MSRRVLPVMLLLLGLAVAACSGTPAASGSSSSTAPAPKAVNIPGAPAGNQVESVVKAAFAGASAVHIKGTLVNSTGSLSLDLQLNKDNTASGTIGEGGPTIPLIAVNGKYYVQFTQALISQSSNAAVSQIGSALTNKWVSSDASIASDMVSGLKPLLTYDSFVSSMFGQSSEVPTLTGTDVVNDIPTLVYESTGGSTVYIAKSSPHYLLRMTAPASGSGQLNFTGWNQPVPVAPPPAGQIYTGPGA